MNRIILIGNGFDLAHGLKTSYGDFCRYVKRYDEELYMFIENYVCVELNAKGLWCNFEHDMGEFDPYFFYRDHDNTDQSHEKYYTSDLYGHAYGMKEEAENKIDKLQQALFGWLGKINFRRVRKKLSLDINDRYLTFNYTPTLNRVYSIPDENILHIHHSLKKHGRNLVFGHNRIIEREPDFDENDDWNHVSNAEIEAEDASKLFLTYFYKNVHAKIKENKDFFDSLRNLDEIIVLGQSINDIDLPYFEYLHKISNNAKWTVSYHRDSELEKMRQTLFLIGVSCDALTFKKMDNIFDNTNT